LFALILVVKFVLQRTANYHCIRSSWKLPSTRDVCV